MADVEIVRVDPGSAEFAQVLSAHRTAKGTLGFLPNAGFTDRAARGTLLAAKQNGRFVGYTLFDLSGDKVKLRHLCVTQDARSSGVARALTEALKKSYRHYRCIEADCRRDYGLDGMWAKLGFHAVHNRPGRSSEGHLLTVWQIDFGHPTLFSAAQLIGELACLDQMVFEDLVQPRAQGLHSRYLLEDWVDELVELCITEEIFIESNQVEDDALRTMLLGRAATFYNLSSYGAEWERLLPEVRTVAPNAGPGDHRHLARAIEGGADYFVTRDRDILKFGSELRTSFGIVVLGPEALLDRLDRERRQERYAPAVLQGTTLAEEPLAAAEQDLFMRSLLNHGEGERAHALRDALHATLADRAASEALVVRDPTGTILAGVLRKEEPRVLVIEALRVRAADRLGDAIARQLLFAQRETAARRKLDRVRLLDPAPSPATCRSLDSEGFHVTDEGWECVVSRGFFTASDVLDESTADEAALWERNNWPGKVVGSGLRSFMVSIEPSYAEQLFDSNLANATLFAREPALGMSREHVYYRSPGRQQNFSGPARIVWYVKGGKPGHPTGHIRAVSQLVEVVVDRPRTLHNRFARLGVWSREQVEAAARRTGLAMALRLTSTELLQRPIPLEAARELYSREGLSFQAPQAPVSVSERMFCLLYKQSSAHA